MGEYAEYGFDQQRLIWYVCRLWDMEQTLLDEGLTLQTSAKHHIPQATNTPYQPLLIKPGINCRTQLTLTSRVFLKFIEFLIVRHVWLGVHYPKPLFPTDRVESSTEADRYPSINCRTQLSQTSNFTRTYFDEFSSANVKFDVWPGP